jgi:hypothetical protein
MILLFFFRRSRREKTAAPVGRRGKWFPFLELPAVNRSQARQNAAIPSKIAVSIPIDPAFTTFHRFCSSFSSEYSDPLPGQFSFPLPLSGPMIDTLALFVVKVKTFFSAFVLA